MTMREPIIVRKSDDRRLRRKKRKALCRKMSSVIDERVLLRDVAAAIPENRAVYRRIFNDIQ